MYASNDAKLLSWGYPVILSDYAMQTSLVWLHQCKLTDTVISDVSFAVSAVHSIQNVAALEQSEDFEMKHCPWSFTFSIIRQMAPLFGAGEMWTHAFYFWSCYWRVRRNLSAVTYCASDGDRQFRPVVAIAETRCTLADLHTSHTTLSYQHYVRWFTWLIITRAINDHD